MEASFEEDIICIRTKSAPPSDDSVVPVHGDPLPCGAEYDRQTAPQVTPRLRTPATVAKAKNKQRRSKIVPAVLDLINQLLLCVPTFPASKLQRHSLVVTLVALRGAKIQLVPASFLQHRLRNAHAAVITVKPAFVMTQGYWCRGCATSRQPTPSLVVDQLQAASVHACCLHNHHGHVPQPLRLMPAGMAFTRELLAAVQRDVQGGCKCKSWWSTWYRAGRQVLVVQLTLD